MSFVIVHQMDEELDVEACETSEDARRYLLNVCEAFEAETASHGFSTIRSDWRTITENVAVMRDYNIFLSVYTPAELWALGNTWRGVWKHWKNETDASFISPALAIPGRPTASDGKFAYA